ncbi:hypothetical protein CDL12_17852 [Handroanthus impetiginosus]|uniref:Uncharacterized protein n=1 Tax=Handroanthus impetiginosus TaxID=429701 RepID=A0A2G9GWA0_9LAMI|nr:hypothetical protein CDL12_17852 [Handroanthus impetiginosus]
MVIFKYCRIGNREIETKARNRFSTFNVGFEPTTNQLTADRSIVELLRNNRILDLIKFNSHSQPMTNMSSNPPS